MVISQSRARSIAFLVAAAMFMNLLDGTVIATALPAMGRAFGTSAVNMNLGITAYLLTLAVFMSLSGWVADRFGARRVFGAAIAVFALASIACGFSRSFETFILARVVQAIAAALMTPVGRLVVLRTTEKSRLMQAWAMMVWPALIAPIVGPPIGGYITTYLGWPWIFFLNAPLGVAAIVATLVLFPADGEPVRHPFDVRGFLLVGVGCFSLIYGLDVIGGRTVPPAIAFGLTALGTLCLVAAAVHLTHARHPLFDLHALRIQTFAVSMLGGSISRLCVASVPFLLPLMFQVAFGMSAAQSGLLLLWLFAGNLAMKSLTTATVRQFGFRSVLLGNGVLTIGSIVSCAFLMPQTPFWASAVVLFLGGASRSMQFTAFGTIMFADVPQEHMSSANTFSSTLTVLAGGLGVALGAQAVRIAAFVHGSAASTPSTADFHLAFLLIAGVAALSLVDVFRLPDDAGRAVSRPGYSS